ncbi:MAG: hypothetical protein WKF91_19410 [Segetibacter sp.]
MLLQKKKEATYRNIIIALLIIATGFLLYKYSSSKFNVQQNLNNLREENKYGFDSLNKAIKYENDLNRRIEVSINKEDFKTAFSLIDSLPPFGKAHSIYIYKGMIGEKQKNYLESIKEYNNAINEIPLSKAKSLRAALYVKMNKLDSALSDYKSIYSYNHYYSGFVANTFMLMKKKDSALKYYQIYLEQYPQDDSVRQKLNSLLE